MINEDGVGSDLEYCLAKMLKYIIAHGQSGAKYTNSIKFIWQNETVKSNFFVNDPQIFQRKGYPSDFSSTMTTIRLKGGWRRSIAASVGGGFLKRGGVSWEGFIRHPKVCICPKVSKCQKY